MKLHKHNATRHTCGTLRPWRRSMRVLCVAEKPSIAKSIAQILSRGSYTRRNGRDKYCQNYDFPYRLPRHLFGGRVAQQGAMIGVDMTFTSVRGHMMEIDFPEDYKWGKCNAFALFTAPIISRIPKEALQVAQNLTTEARTADMLMIWTDCDREGEHIGYEIMQHCRAVRRSIIVKRARFSALIANQVQAACVTPVDLDLDAAHAVSARQEIDLRAGAAFTRLQTMQLRSQPELEGLVISYGPCQFPTLGFVVDHYKRVQEFVPEPFWYIDVRHRASHTPNGTSTVEFQWDRKHLFDETIVQLMYKRCKNAGEAIVVQTTCKPTRKR